MSTRTALPGEFDDEMPTARTGPGRVQEATADSQVAP